jgi:hypothetical protein
MAITKETGKTKDARKRRKDQEDLYDAEYGSGMH